MDRLEIETRPVFYPMHFLPPYLEDNAYPVAEDFSIRGINLPTHRNLSRMDQERVVEALHKAISGVK
jgi:perosamine synthetase